MWHNCNHDAVISWLPRIGKPESEHATAKIIAYRQLFCTHEIKFLLTDRKWRPQNSRMNSRLTVGGVRERKNVVRSQVLCYEAWVRSLLCHWRRLEHNMRLEHEHKEPPMSHISPHSYISHFSFMSISACHDSDHGQRPSASSSTTRP